MDSSDPGRLHVPILIPPSIFSVSVYGNVGLEGEDRWRADSFNATRRSRWSRDSLPIRNSGTFPHMLESSDVFTRGPTNWVLSLIPLIFSPKCVASYCSPSRYCSLSPLQD
ncbi:hypothetical protein Bbelb_124100 [Branchiostoma belcheri]|nr:hypothetical protein Bbelb_124100 [Branchiostoma belcheri]